MLSKENLESFITRIENLETEKKELQNSIKEVYAEAEEAGLDKKALKKIISIRKKSKIEHMQEQYTIDAYMLLLEGEEE